MLFWRESWWLCLSLRWISKTFCHPWFLRIFAGWVIREKVDTTSYNVAPPNAISCFITPSNSSYNYICYQQKSSYRSNKPTIIYIIHIYIHSIGIQHPMDCHHVPCRTPQLESGAGVIETCNRLREWRRICVLKFALIQSWIPLGLICDDVNLNWVCFWIWNGFWHILSWFQFKLSSWHWIKLEVDFEFEMNLNWTDLLEVKLVDSKLLELTLNENWL